MLPIPKPILVVVCSVISLGLLTFLSTSSHSPISLLYGPETARLPATSQQGFGYYLPVSSIVDHSWVRMSTILSQAHTVCDSSSPHPTKPFTELPRLPDYTCDMTVVAPTGWENLCHKTRAMFDKLCHTRAYAPYKYIVKVDDDAIIDPLVESLIETLHGGGDVYFGTTYGPNTKFDLNNNTWFGGWFYGVNTEVLDKVCECGLPECKRKMGEDQWFGYTLGQCNIDKTDLVIPETFVKHKKYKSTRLRIKFTTVR